MQLTPEILQKFAETAVKELTGIDRDIVSIYLCGSLVMGSNPLLGGTTDIDLVVIHSREPAIRREILRLILPFTADRSASSWAMLIRP